MKKVLILANENERAAVATIRSLKEIDEIKIHVAVTKKNLKNKLIFKNNMKDTLFYSTTCKDTYIKSLLEIKNIIGPYFLFNFGDQITKWTLEEKKFLAKYGILLNAPTIENFNNMLDKSTFIKTCEKYGLEKPLEHNADMFLSENIYNKPFVIKAKFSNTTNEKILKSPLIVENEKSLERLLKMKLQTSNHFVQEYIKGPSIYYCAMYENGEKTASFEQKNISQQPGGKSVLKAIPYSLPLDVTEKIDNMFYDMNWNGIMMIEMKESNNKYYMIECNPRLWGPLQLAIDNGIMFPQYILGYYSSKKPIKDNIGYVWYMGYIIGFLYKIQTSNKFQKYLPDKKEKYIYKDVWLRKGTLQYFCLELFFLMLSQVIKNIKK